MTETGAMVSRRPASQIYKVTCMKSVLGRRRSYSKYSLDEPFFPSIDIEKIISTVNISCDLTAN